MSDKTLQELYILYRNRSLSKGELEQFNDALLDPDREAELSALMDASWNGNSLNEQPIAKHIADRHVLSILSRSQVSPKGRRPWYRIAGIAATLLILATVGLTVYYQKQARPEDSPAIAILRPGSTRAFITLADGKKITVEKDGSGQLAKDHGATISKASGLISYLSGPEDAAGSLNSITTPNGGQISVILSDGTKVTLNAGSKLTFPLAFARSSRQVILSGEAYFEVAHNPKAPFTVVSANQKVKVLGTHFNIQAYPSSGKITTTLLQGSVSVSSGGSSSNREAVLHPGEQSVLEGGRIGVNPADTQEAVAWTNGMFMLTDRPLEEIMDAFSKWYGLEIQYQDPEMRKETFGIKISRTEDGTKVLSMLERTGNVHFKIAGRRVIVMH